MRLILVIKLRCYDVIILLCNFFRLFKIDFGNEIIIVSFSVDKILKKSCIKGFKGILNIIIMNKFK